MAQQIFVPATRLRVTLVRPGEVIPPHGDFVPVGAPVKGYPGPPPGEGSEGFSGKGYERLS
ncbi:hypothetical protein YIM73518_24710 [Thermus brockianus]